eukprot:6492706-Amphidinium_carterae.2
MSKRQKTERKATLKDEPYYEWELPRGSMQRGAVEEKRDEEGDESSDTDVDTVTGDAAAERLKALLIDEHRAGNITAKTVCLLSFWAHQAGLKPLKSMGQRPGTASGNYSRHLHAVYEKEGHTLNKGLLYQLPCPGYVRADGQRGKIHMSLLPLHEALLGEDKDMLGKMQQQLAQWTATPSYTQHPVVEKFSKSNVPVMPYYIFLDGVQYGKKNSMLVVSCANLCTMKRHLLGVVRKRLCCGSKGSCSCGGWCTYNSLWTFLKWSVDALAEGKFPDARCPNDLDQGLEGGWSKEDSSRANLAGTAMVCAGALIQIRADWAEVSHTLGVCSWADLTDPCFLCSLPHAQLYSNIGDRLWHVPLKSGATYHRACSLCEHCFEAGLETHADTIEPLLHTDLRKDGARGRALRDGVPALGLKAGDRVEPTSRMMDYATWEENGCKAPVTFWRRTAETATRHRCPIFECSGVSINTSMTVDVMHTLCLGIYQDYACRAVWVILHNNCFEVEFAQVALSARWETNVGLLQKALNGWYKHMARNHPDTIVTRLHECSLDTFGGSPSTPKLRAKAHQTLTLLRFLDYKLSDWQGKLPQGASWFSTAHHLLSMWNTMERGGVILDAEEEEVSMY